MDQLGKTQNSFFFQGSVVCLSLCTYVSVHLCIYHLLVGEELKAHFFFYYTNCCQETGCKCPLPTNASLIHPSLLRWCRVTYQLCNSAKAALIFFTELSTSSLIIIRYLVRETVQRCKSFTDFSMFGPKIENKNCTEVRKPVLAFLNEEAGIIQQVICPD